MAPCFANVFVSYAASGGLAGLSPGRPFQSYYNLFLILLLNGNLFDLWALSPLNWPGPNFGANPPLMPAIFNFSASKEGPKGG